MTSCPGRSDLQFPVSFSMEGGRKNALHEEAMEMNGVKCRFPKYLGNGPS